MRNTTVYLSSTFEDLKQIREAACRTLGRLGYICRAMEDYVASDERPLDQCLREVAESNVYVGIFAWRYGFRPEDRRKNPEHLSITELEYHQACATNKPRFIFLLREDALWPPMYVDGLNAQVTTAGEGGVQPILALRNRLQRERVVSFFSNEKDLCEQLAIALARWAGGLWQAPQMVLAGTTGRVARAAEFKNMPDSPTAADFVGREEALEALAKYLGDDRTAVVSITGDTGIGKSLLVSTFLDRMAKHKPPYRGCQWKYAWSFYSQGMRSAESSSSEFFADVLRYFRLEGEGRDLSEDQRVTRLIELLRTEQTILVLDGVDPLLDKAEGTFRPAGFRDVAMKRFLETLCTEAGAEGTHRGLVVVTSVQPFVGEEGGRRYGGAYQVIPIDPLSEKEGADLLEKLLPARKEGPPRSTLEAVSKKAEGQPLGLALLGRLLALEFEGDVGRYGEVLAGNTEHSGDCATRVLAWHYRKWTCDPQPEGFPGRACLSLMRMVSLFSRPVSDVELNALISARVEVAQPLLSDSYPQTAALPGTERQDRVHSPTARTIAEGYLQTAGLLVRKSTDDWEMHPTVRTFFRRRFKDEQPQAWKKAHEILFGYFKQKARKRPESEEEIEVVSRAIHHGSLCGRFQEAWELYWHRVARQREGYITENLGLVGWDLMMLSRFFPSETEEWWKANVAPNLDRDCEGWLRSRASYGLELLGRLEAAKEQRRRAVDAWQGVNNVWACADGTEKLALMRARTEDLESAQQTADEAVRYASQAVATPSKRKEDLPTLLDTRIHALTVKGAILYRLGRFDEADRCFEEAEREENLLAGQQDVSAVPRFLHSEPGARYFLFLLDRGCGLDELEHRIRQMRLWEHEQQGRGRRQPGYLVRALHRLSKGRFHVFRGERFWEEAANEFDEAVRLVKQAHNRAYQCQPLLARADLRRRLKNYDEALADLVQVDEISGPMVVYQTQALLMRASIYLDLAFGGHNLWDGEQTALGAAEIIKRCRQLIRQTHYMLRKPDLELLEVRRDRWRDTAKDECLSRISRIESELGPSYYRFFRSEADRVKGGLE